MFQRPIPRFIMFGVALVGPVLIAITYAIKQSSVSVSNWQLWLLSAGIVLSVGGGVCLFGDTFDQSKEKSHTNGKALIWIGTWMLVVSGISVFYYSNLVGSAILALMSLMVIGLGAHYLPPYPPILGPHPVRFFRQIGGLVILTGGMVFLIGGIFLVAFDYTQWNGPIALTEGLVLVLVGYFLHPKSPIESGNTPDRPRRNPPG